MTWYLAMIIGAVIGVISSFIFYNLTVKTIGVFEIDEKNVEHGLFSIRFSDDPTTVSDGTYIRFRVSKK